MKSIIAERLQEHNVPVAITADGVLAMSDAYGRALINTWDECRNYLGYGEKVTAPARFLGIQEGIGHIPNIELWDLMEDIDGHCVGSTVSRQTLEKAGFYVPTIS